MVNFFFTEFLLSTYNRIVLREIPRNSLRKKVLQKKNAHSPILSPILYVIFCYFRVIGDFTLLRLCTFLGPQKFSNKIRFYFNPVYMLQTFCCSLYRFLLPIGYTISKLNTNFLHGWQSRGS